jgi:hypothetical protein
MSAQITRRSLVAGAAALPALAIPAVAATRDPAVDAVQHLKLTAEATYRLVRELDEAEGDAWEQHGHRPLRLVQWRNYDISGSEIDQRRTALLADGGDTRQIEAEYQDAKAREKELIKAGEEWDARVGITSLRERTEAAWSAKSAAEDLLAQTQPTTAAGAAALLDVIIEELETFGTDQDWTVPTLVNISAALRRMGGVA